MHSTYPSAGRITEWNNESVTAIAVAGQSFVLERARAADLAAIVALLRDDPLGAARESCDLAVYEPAFRAIDADPNQFLAAVRSEDGELVGTMQLTLIPGLARRAATRLQIEGVRIAARVRGIGLGAAMFAWAHEYGRSRQAKLVQLTTDKSRGDAHRFYARLGYRATHEGLKLDLTERPESD